jgi:hypothetical protein
LRNLYIYFWRWAARKVFEDVPGQEPGGGSGIVAYITAAGFLSGPGFARMRQALRQRCHEIWVIDCSPEGHQPEVADRVFQGVQQPVCIVLAARWRGSSEENKPPAQVRWRALPEGHRRGKFDALTQLRLDSPGWLDCSADDRAPFLPESVGAWPQFPRLEDLFDYDGSGVMPGRTWVIAPDASSLDRRWRSLQSAKPEDKERLFFPHLRNGKLGDKHVSKVVEKPLAGFSSRSNSVAADTDPVLPPVRYGFRSFDRQWIIPDSRLINQANPTLWQSHSSQQVYLTVPQDRSPSGGPSLTCSASIPDVHHYAGRGGRTFPLWRDSQATKSNVKASVITHLQDVLGRPVSGEDLFAYIVAIAAHPAYIQRFGKDLATPGLRIPLTAEPDLFTEAVALGQRTVWLHTFGERFADPAQNRPHGQPRMADGQRPQVPADGAIPLAPENMPDTLEYDPALKRLKIGTGYIEPVAKAIWDYQVSGKQVLVQWFSYRRRNRERPQIGDRRPPSALGDIQPDRWLPEYTTELLNVLNALGLLIELEPQAGSLLDRICGGRLVTQSMLDGAGAFFPVGHSPVGATGQAPLPGFQP